jgi:hypothetical protein
MSSVMDGCPKRQVVPITITGIEGGGRRPGNAARNDARTTRRALLIEGSSGVAAIAADVARRSAPASADNGDSVILGAANEATLPTEIVNSSIPGVAMRLRGNDVPGLESHSQEITGPLGSLLGTGLHAFGRLRGIAGEARKADASFSAGIGVQGHSGSGEGVREGASSGVGVRGIASGIDGRGVLAQNEQPRGLALSVVGRAHLYAERHEHHCCRSVHGHDNRRRDLLGDADSGGASAEPHRALGAGRGPERGRLLVHRFG